MKLAIYFKSGECAMVDDFTHVYDCSAEESIKADNFYTLELTQSTYGFVGSKTTITANGNEILYLQMIT